MRYVVAPLSGGWGAGGGCYSTKPPTMHIFVAISKKMPEISAIENLCFQKKWAKVHQKFLGDAPPKTSHHAKFHRDRSNQLGDRGWSEKQFPHTDTHTHTYGILTG